VPQRFMLCSASGRGRLALSRRQIGSISTFQARIERVVKATAHLPLRDGGQLVFEEDGGSAPSVERESTPRFRGLGRWSLGNRYLLFGRIQNGRFVIQEAYEEPAAGSTLKKTTRRMPTVPGTDTFAVTDNDELELRLDELIAHVEAEVPAAPR
jgi:hypothetical protein